MRKKEKTEREIVPNLSPSKTIEAGQKKNQSLPAGKLVAFVHIVIGACPGTPAGLLRTLHWREEEGPSPLALSAEAAKAATSARRISSSSGFIVLSMF